MLKQYLSSESLRNTENRSRRSATGNVSPKVHSQIWLKNQTVGKRAEEIVVFNLKKSGFELLAERLKFPNGEVDLIFARGGLVLLIEVKSLFHEWAVFDRISKNQLQKIRSNRVLLANRFQKLRFETWVAFVSSQNLGKIEFAQVD